MRHPRRLQTGTATRAALDPRLGGILVAGLAALAALAFAPDARAEPDAVHAAVSVHVGNVHVVYGISKGGIDKGGPGTGHGKGPGKGPGASHGKGHGKGHGVGKSHGVGKGHAYGKGHGFGAGHARGKAFGHGVPLPVVHLPAIFAKHPPKPKFVPIVFEPDLSRAWARLYAGAPRDALRLFARAAAVHPTSALARVGIALSEACLGNDGRAVHAMRQAVLCDPDVFRRVPVDARAVGVFASLERRARTQAWRDRCPADAWFLVGAFAGLRGDLRAAHDALARAVRAGDPDGSTRVLLAALESQLARGWHPTC